MTNISEKLTTQIAQKFFFEKNIYTNVFFNNSDGENELCDILIEFIDFYICIQVKEKSKSGKSDDLQWFKKTVLKKAIKQAKESEHTIKNEGIDFYIYLSNREKKHICIDHNKSTIQIVVFCNSEIITYDRCHFSKSLNKIINIFSYDDFNIVTDIICEYCDVPMEREPGTRTSPQKDIICPKCGHIYYESGWRTCFCDNCRMKVQKEKKEKEEIKKQAICNCLDLEHDKPLYKEKDITNWERIILGALVSFTMDENLEYIQPLCNFSRKLLPGEDKSLSVLKELYHQGIIILGNRYYTDAFTINERNDATSYTVNRVFYEIWVDDAEFCKNLINPQKFLTDEELLFHWRNCNKNEAIEFLLEEFNKIGIKSFSPGKKTEEIFSAMVEKLSLSQIFRVIHYITEKTAKDILSGEKSYKHAANATITRMESYFNRAIYENYSLYNVRYEDNLSMVTTYLYNKILNMGDSAFYSVPNAEKKEMTILPNAK